jgi:hypothetical protein
MKEYGEILLGVVLAALGVAGIVHWYIPLLEVIKGVIGIIVLMVGAVFLMIGISDVREKGEEEIEMGEVAESGTEEEEKSE